MNFGPTNPLSVRRAFRQKPVVDVVVVAAGFIVVAFILSGFIFSLGLGWIPMLIADTFALGLAYICLMSFETRTLEFDCSSCGERISVNTPWICGVCGHANKNTEEYPLCHKCESCGSAPKAYKCHHVGCGKLNFLSEDPQETNYAYCLKGKGEEPETDKREEKLRKQQEKKEEKEHKILIADLDSKLKVAREKGKKPALKSARERMQEDFDKAMGECFGADEIAAEQIAALQKDPRFKKDRAGRERREDAIRAWARRSIR